MGKRQGLLWQSLQGDLSPLGFLIVASGHEQGPAGGVGAAALPDDPLRLGDCGMVRNLRHVVANCLLIHPESAADGAVAVAFLAQGGRNLAPLFLGQLGAISPRPRLAPAD